jgi:signal transduction histidine kinase
MRPRLHDLPLRQKVVLILTVVVLGYAALDGLIQRYVVYESFVRLEQREAARDMERVRAALRNEESHLQQRALDWATSDEVGRFVAGADQDGAHASLDEHTLARNKLDLLVLCRPSGAVAWGRAISGCEDKDSQRIEFHDFPNESLSLSHPLLLKLDPADPAKTASGWMETEHGRLLVCARWLLDVHGGGRGRGFVVLGRLFTPAFHKSLEEQTGVEFTLRAVLEAEAGPELDAATASMNPVVSELDAQWLRVLATLPDINQGSALLVETRSARELSSSGATALRYALLSTVAAGLLMMLALLFLLTRTVLRPLAQLTAHALAIGRSEELTRKLDLARTDEIGVLSGEFDRMMEKLAQSRAQVVRAARAAGMSEIATGVLHNVGNVLNSVNVSASVLTQNARRSGAADLKRVVETIRGSGGDLATFVARDPRGAHLDPLLEQLSEQLLRENQELGRELGSLSRGIDHIKELIQSQQGVAGRAGVLEDVQPSELLESALALTVPASLGREPQIVREYQQIAPCPLDRHRTMEVLVNVVQNARQALLTPGLAQQVLILRIAADSPDALRIEIEDSGPGIAQADMARIFTHGFTTKTGGHGFGLHASANAATEMGGKLSAHSAGPGRGACFVLALQLKRARAAAISGGPA